MKTIGIVGGIGWPSTTTYYRAIHELTSKHLGGPGTHCAELVLVQTDFYLLERLVQDGRWEEVANSLVALVKRLQSAGADFFIIPCNTFHLVAPQIESKIDLPMVHIVDATARKITQKGYKTVGLIGSQYTMTRDYFIGRLVSQYGLIVLVPDEGQRSGISQAVRSQLLQGIFLSDTRSLFMDAITGLAGRGAEAVILGCTEIGILVQDEHSSVPLIDTAIAHAEAAVERALGG